MIPTVLLIVLITFTLGFYGPGDPIRAMYGSSLPIGEASRSALRHQLGLDRPYAVQFSDYIGSAASGEFSGPTCFRMHSDRSSSPHRRRSAASW
jgi:peptide/nickel transport system permease protein